MPPALALAPAAAEPWRCSEDLLRRAQSGDSSALREIYDAHARKLAGLAFRMLGASNDLEDIVQDTFSEAFRGLSRLREPEALGGWLRTIAVRVVHRYLRARYKARSLEERRHDYAAPDATGNSEAGAAAELYLEVARLPPAVRVPWTLRRIEGFALADIVMTCELSLATVKRRIRRGDRALRGHKG